MIQIIAIVTKDSGVYVRQQVDRWVTHHNFTIYLDGKLPTATYEPGWYHVPALPTSFQQRTAERSVLSGWDLKQSHIALGLPPRIELEDPSPGDDVLSTFYTPTYMTIPSQLEEIQVELHVIAEVENWQPVRSDFTPSFSLIDKIAVHPDLLRNCPCSIDSKQLYNIVREHIKSNIDPKVAQMSLEYDSCLRVDKRIKLADTREERVDVSSYRARKPKMVTKHIVQRTSTIFECCHTPHQSYPVIKPLWANNQQELQEVLDNYLKELMAKINEPLVDCPHCKGLGVVTPCC